MPCNAMGASAANARSHPASANASLGPSGPHAPAKAPGSREPPDDRNAGLRASAQRDVLLLLLFVLAAAVWSLVWQRQPGTRKSQEL